MRGSETYDYVNRIRQRWMLYRGGKTDMEFSGGGSGINGMTISPVPSVPQRAKHKYRFHV
jgi:membrane-bound lytic murein transglycosylase F